MSEPTAHADDWTTIDLAARIDRGNPEGAAQVLRVMAHRIAARTDGVTDPRSLVLDLGHAVGSIAEALPKVLADVVDDADEVDAALFASMVDDLTRASRMLDGIAQGWI